MDERLLKADTIVFDIGNVLLRFDPDKVALLLLSGRSICGAALT